MKIEERCHTTSTVTGSLWCKGPVINYGEGGGYKMEKLMFQNLLLTPSKQGKKLKTCCAPPPPLSAWLNLFRPSSPILYPPPPIINGRSLTSSYVYPSCLMFMFAVCLKKCFTRNPVLFHKVLLFLSLKCGIWMHGWIKWVFELRVLEPLL